MQHLGTKRIETRRLLLRPFTMEDASAMFRNWASDPEVTRFLTWPAHESVEVTRWVLKDWTTHYDQPDFYQWAIVPKDLGEPIGAISVVEKNDGAQWVEMGYCIGKSWWRQGYVSEALQALIAFFFEEVGLSRIQACHDPRNPNSGAVMRKCGMTYEGTLRRFARNNMGICGVSYYGILRREYDRESGMTDPFLC